MHEAQLLEAIRQARDDDAPRLVYADWLSDQGDPRGDFIRVQCALARDEDLDPDLRWDLREREEELIDAYGEQWRLSSSVTFQRGFPNFRVGVDTDEDQQKVSRTVIEDLVVEEGHHVRAPGIVDRLVPHAAGLSVMAHWEVMRHRLLSSAAGRGLRRLNVAGRRDVSQVVETPWERIQSLGFLYGAVDDSFLRKLAAAPPMQGLRKLDLTSCSDVTPGGVRAVARLPLLEELSLSGVDRIAAETPVLLDMPSLRRLSLEEVALPDGRFGAVLRAGPWAERLVELRLARTGISSDTLRAACDLPSLRTLGVELCSLGSVDLRACRAPLESLALSVPLAGLPPTLRRLTFQGRHLGELLRLIPATLRELILVGTEGEDPIPLLASAPPRLRRLVLPRLSSASVRLLSQSPAFAGLRSISVDEPLSDADVRALVHPDLSILFLFSITAAQAEMLADPANLPSLRAVAVPASLSPAARARLTERGIRTFYEVIPTLREDR
jgi:uncharacterized protein (TIGR02996 family)